MRILRRVDHLMLTYQRTARNSGQRLTPPPPPPSFPTASYFLPYQTRGGHVVHDWRWSMSESPMSPLVPRARFSEIDQARNQTAGEPILFRALAIVWCACLRRPAEACFTFVRDLARGVTRHEEVKGAVPRRCNPPILIARAASRLPDGSMFCWDVANNSVHVRKVCIVFLLFCRCLYVLRPAAQCKRLCRHRHPAFTLQWHLASPFFTEQQDVPRMFQTPDASSTARSQFLI